MTNLAEHPIALDLMKRIAAADEVEGKRSIPAQIFFPGMGQMMGLCRAGETPGIFILSSNVKIQGGGQEGVMDFSFTADKPITIIHPDLTQEPGGSRIIQ
jgi:hypothetical protein